MVKLPSLASHFVAVFEINLVSSQSHWFPIAMFCQKKRIVSDKKGSEIEDMTKVQQNWEFAQEVVSKMK